MKLNLGCGYKHKEGFINIDCFKGCKPDIVLDFNKFPYPFKDNSIDYIYSFHCLEHLDPNKIMRILEELYRISKHHCIWEIHVPYYNSPSTGNIDHKITWGFDSFNFIEKTHDRNYYSKVRGEVLEIVGVPSIVGKWIPFKKFRQYLSYFIGHIIRALEFKIRIIKKEDKEV